MFTHLKTKMVFTLSLDKESKPTKKELKIKSQAALLACSKKLIKVRIIEFFNK